MFILQEGEENLSKQGFFFSKKTRRYSYLGAGKGRGFLVAIVGTFFASLIRSNSNNNMKIDCNFSSPILQLGGGGEALSIQG